MNRIMLCTLAAVTAGCGASPGEPAASAAGVEAVERNEGLVRTWTITMTLDSIRRSGGDQWSTPTPPRIVRGTLTVALAGGGTGVRGVLDADLSALLGRDMSCYEAGWQPLAVHRSHRQVTLHFTPGAADCGFGARLAAGDRGLDGTWDEMSFVGPVAAGRMTLSPVD